MQDHTCYKKLYYSQAIGTLSDTDMNEWCPWTRISC